MTVKYQLKILDNKLDKIKLIMIYTERMLRSVLCLLVN